MYVASLNTFLLSKQIRYGINNVNATYQVKAGQLIAFNLPGGGTLMIGKSKSGQPTVSYCKKGAVGTLNYTPRNNVLILLKEKAPTERTLTPTTNTPYSFTDEESGPTVSVDENKTLTVRHPGSTTFRPVTINLRGEITGPPRGRLERSEN